MISLHLVTHTTREELAASRLAHCREQVRRKRMPNALVPQLETGKINCVRLPRCGRLPPGSADVNSPLGKLFGPLDLTKSDAARFPPTAGISLSSTESRNRNCCTDRNADAAKVDSTDQLYWQEKIRPIIGRRPCPQGH
jgi:hypothetical protein